jgi:hypothetical protein
MGACAVATGGIGLDLRVFVAHCCGFVDLGEHLAGVASASTTALLCSLYSGRVWASVGVCWAFFVWPVSCLDAVRLGIHPPSCFSRFRFGS